MNTFSTLAALAAAVVVTSSHAGDITPESLALMAAPWRPMAARVAAKPAPLPVINAQVTRPAAEEAYDYDPPAGGWHTPGTRPASAIVTTASR
jgi:hypothetical protein